MSLTEPGSPESVATAISGAIHDLFNAWDLPRPAGTEIRMRAYMIVERGLSGPYAAHTDALGQLAGYRLLADHFAVAMLDLEERSGLTAIPIPADILKQTERVR